MFDAQKIKKDFPIFERKIRDFPLVYLDSGATSQKPYAVLDAMDLYYKNNNANIHRGVYDMSVESTKMVDESRSKIAKFIGGRDEEIVFIRNASEGINLVMNTWGKENINSQDAIIVSRLEHHSNLIPWQELCRQTGAELRVVDVDSNGEMMDMSIEVKEFSERGLRVKLGGLQNLVDEKVKLVAITGASNVLGSITELNKILNMVKRKNEKVMVLLDASQLVPHMKVDVRDLGIDFMVFSGHKMLGPTGIGVLWGKKDILNAMPPFLFGGDMIGEVSLTGATWADLPSKFEAGTPDIAGIIGLGAAVSYLESLGMDNVRKHEEELTRYAMDKMKVLVEDKVVDMYGPDYTKRVGVIPFNVIGIHPHDVAQVLNSFGIAVRSGQHCAAPLVTSFGVPAMVRATFYVYNTKEDVDYLVEKIREVNKVFA